MTDTEKIKFIRANLGEYEFLSAFDPRVKRRWKIEEVVHLDQWINSDTGQSGTFRLGWSDDASNPFAEKNIPSLDYAYNALYKIINEKNGMLVDN